MTGKFTAFNHVRTIIDEYLNEKDTDYSIMISGKWGTGKTYYFDHEIIPWIRNHKNLKSFKISLFGKDLKDVYDEIFFQMLSLPNTMKKIKGIFNIDWSQLPYVGGFLLKSPISINSDSLIKNFLLREGNEELKNTVIIFDDFERSNIDVIDRLSIIDHLSSLGVKVLVITNEERMESKESEGKSDEHKKKIYQNFKEKVIRRTVEFAPSFGEFFQNIISENIIKNVVLREILIEDEKIIKEKLEEYKYIIPVNLRTLKESLRIIDRIYPVFVENIYEKSSVKKIIVEKFIGIYSYCSVLKEHGVIFTELIINRTIMNVAIKEHSKNRDRSEEENLKIEIAKFLLHQGGKSIYGCQSIIGFIYEGYLDEEKLKKEVQDFYGKNQIMIQKLQNWWDDGQSADEISEAEKEFWQAVEEKEVSFNVMIKMIPSLMMLAKEKILDCTEEEMKGKIMNHMKDYTGEIDNEFSLKIMLSQYIIEADIRDQIYDSFSRTIDQNTRDQFLQNARKCFFEKTLSVAEFHQTVASEPLPFDEIADEMIESLNAGDVDCARRFQMFLHLRYKSENIADYISNDVKWLNSLKVRLECETPLAERLQRYFYDSVLKQLDASIKKLSNSQHSIQ